MLQWLKDFQAQAATQLAKFNNSTFKEALMATCAMVAAADGTVSPEERSKLAKLIQANEMLQVFGATELRDLFLAYADKAGDEFQRLDLEKLIRKVKTNEAQADYVLKTALIIANSDGDFSASEKAVVTSLCKLLGVPAANYLPA